MSVETSSASYRLARGHYPSGAMTPEEHARLRAYEAKVEKQRRKALSAIMTRLDHEGFSRLAKMQFLTEHELLPVGADSVEDEVIAKHGFNTIVTRRMMAIYEIVQEAGRGAILDPDSTVIQVRGINSSKGYVSKFGALNGVVSVQNAFALWGDNFSVAKHLCRRKAHIRGDSNFWVVL